MRDCPMAGKGLQTRERILATAEPMVLRQGFAGTSLDDLVKATGLTKGAFFHHFKGNAELAQTLVERNADNDYELFERLAAEADDRPGDPLDSVIVFLRLFESVIEGRTE